MADVPSVGFVSCGFFICYWGEEFDSVQKWMTALHDVQNSIWGGVDFNCVQLHTVHVYFSDADKPEFNQHQQPKL